MVTEPSSLQEAAKPTPLHQVRTVSLQNVRQVILQNSLIRAIVEEHHDMEDVTASEDTVTVTMAFPMAMQSESHR